MGGREHLGLVVLIIEIIITRFKMVADHSVIFYYFESATCLLSTF